MEAAFEKNARYITRIFFISIGFFAYFFFFFFLKKADFTKVLWRFEHSWLRTRTVSNYFALFPTIFCLFQKVCLPHKSVRERQQKGTMQIYKYANGKERIFLARGIEKLSALAQSLGRWVILLFPPLPSTRIWGLYIFYIFLIVLFSGSKSRVENIDRTRAEI